MSTVRLPIPPVDEAGMLTIQAPIYAVIIEDGHLIEVRQVRADELAAWRMMARGVQAESIDGKARRDKR